jgi:hypothetical protein
MVRTGKACLQCINQSEFESLYHVVDIPDIRNLTRFLQHSHFLRVMKKVGSEDKIVETLVFAEDDFLICAFPLFRPWYI